MTVNISVCMAVKNGSLYIHEQLTSILPQLGGNDEIIISDDHSSDDTIKIIEQFHDNRIRLIHNPDSGVISNFENALRSTRGTYVFLADQDDVWMPDKVKATIPFLLDYDLVVTDCIIVNDRLEGSLGSFHHLNRSQKGLLRNLLRNSYMGCCMAFHRKLLTRAMPFPKKIPMHDIWLGLIAEKYFKVKFIDQALLYHRRHLSNASTTADSSNASFIEKVTWRFWLLKNIIAMPYAS